MTPQRAKELLPVIQAFAAGKTVQYRRDSSRDWSTANLYLNFNDGNDYRIKPEVVKVEPYKRWLGRDGKGGFSVAIHHWKWSQLGNTPESSSHFVKWLDDDWIQVFHEVEA